MLFTSNDIKSRFVLTITVTIILFLLPSIEVVCSTEKEAIDINHELAKTTLNVSTTTKPSDITIIPKPILFDQERIALTRKYRLEHYGIKSKSILIQPQIIVLHWTVTRDFASAYNTFYPTVLQGRDDIAKGGALNVSAHFLVDRDGKIYQLMPTNWMARHVIGLNNIAIGVENVGGINDREDLTPEQAKANMFLVKYLQAKYPGIKYLIGHYEYGKFRYTNLWQEKDKSYFTTKTDPGVKFMQAVRQGLGLR